jgi:hypothetical protein
VYGELQLHQRSAGLDAAYLASLDLAPGWKASYLAPPSDALDVQVPKGVEICSGDAPGEELGCSGIQASV